MEDLTEHNLQGPPPAVNLQGPPPAANLQGPPPAVNLQGLPLSPSAVNTEGIFLEQGVLLSMKLHMNSPPASPHSSPPVHIVHHQSTYFYHCQV